MPIKKDKKHQFNNGFYGKTAILSLEFHNLL